ncbi:hypothetical protein MVEN_02039100 [Mycena venus]|uniref:Uncharacterized protein n=1 Tax=Mycena venus TaxID=2733690 RepID=A0A8H7CJZ6_9AGAR|nr:hypothetical protein MVEN_02039100 [Mycena venus]
MMPHLYGTWQMEIVTKDTTSIQQDKSADSAVDSPFEGCSTQAVPKKSWVEACIQAAAQVTEPMPSPPLVCATRTAKRRRWDDRGIEAPEILPARKRRWVEAMEAAGNANRPADSNWVEAMARTAQQIPTKKNKKQDDDIHDKENCRPLPGNKRPRHRTRWDVCVLRLDFLHESSDTSSYTIRRDSEPLPPNDSKENGRSLSNDEPPRRKSRWDVSVKIPKTFERSNFDALASGAAIREGNTLHLGETHASAPSVPSRPPDQILRPINRLPASLPRLESILSGPTTSQLNVASGRDTLEPLCDVKMPAAASLGLPPLDCANVIVYDDSEPWTRSGTCSPMEMSPTCSPTKFIPLPSQNGRYSAPDLLPNSRAASPALSMDTPVKESNPIAFRGTAGRGRSDSLCSTSSSHMAISVCSSPTKFIVREETPFLCSPMRRGLSGGSEPSSDSHLSKGGSPSTTEPAESVVAQGSTFWPGQTLIFRYKQRKKPLRPII